ncbi:MAG: type I DNA topoisomerase [bacterium]|nr:type I DNA topoisomerase [bacterium]
MPSKKKSRKKKETPLKSKTDAKIKEEKNTNKKEPSSKTPSSKRKLLIVESPTKAKTIKNYLGRDFDVIASKGHIKDLPENTLGIKIEKGFEPKIVILPQKREVVKQIQKKSQEAEEIYIGSDPDREGEAIAKHIKEEIEKKVKNKPIKRALFYEITREEIIKAIQNAGDIDEKKVKAQKARRILDRLVGYLVSPLLWKTIKKGLSAGRVQSVALRLICEREKERQAFKKETYYIIKILISKDGKNFWATLKTDEPLKEKVKAEEIINSLKGKKVTVSFFEKKQLKIKPYPPLKTSTLQQEASKRYRFSPGKTMSIAQKLYEGVEIDGKNVGLITYMRTDSLRLSEKAISAIRSLIKEQFGTAYLPPAPINHETGGKLVQGAHEAIRPTHPNLAPESLVGKLEGDSLRVYELIWKRALASQGSYAQEEVKEANLEVDGLKFVARGKKLIFEGFYRILGEIPHYEDIPELEKGEQLDIIDVRGEVKETEPPPRYTEASLIRTMEHLGIGRPSTYAPTLETLYERKYIKKERGYLVPTDLGFQVNDILISRFRDIFEVKFTAKMEEELDEIESGKKRALEILEKFYTGFSEDLKSFQENIKDIKEELQRTEETCPLCGSPLLLKWSKYGKFYACSRYPECKYTRPAEANEVVDKKCPICQKPMILVEGKRGKYYRCVDYPKCKGTLPYTLGIKCPECDGEIVERRGPRGKVFYGCSNYPECKFITSHKPVDVKCPACGYPIMLEKKGRKGKIYLECPKCKNKIEKEEKYEKGSDL